jgi:hypothetical protein
MALALTATLGCVDRRIGLVDCEDGYLQAGEVCLGDAGDLRRADFQPLAMQVADFDGDEHLDVLMLGVVEWSVTSVLMPGDGTGRLGDGRDSNVHGCSAYPIPGDLDGDAAADLLVAECGPSMLIFSGGTEGFGPGRSVATGAVPRTSSIFDVDRDGRNDIVVLGADDAGVVTMNVARADGQGGFAPPASSAVSELLPGFDPWSFGVEDIDEDGLVDALLVDTSESGGGFALARGKGDGTFGPPEPIPADVSPAGAWLRDFDGDDHLDLLVRDHAAPELVLLQGDGRGGFVPGARTERDEATPLASAAIGDLDGDGRDDLVFGYPGDTILEVRLGEKDGSFGEPSELEAGGEPQQIALGDLDEDGALDLVVGTFADGGIRVILARP